MRTREVSDDVRMMLAGPGSKMVRLDSKRETLCRF